MQRYSFLRYLFLFSFFHPFFSVALILNDGPWLWKATHKNGTSYRMKNRSGFLTMEKEERLL